MSKGTYLGYLPPLGKSSASLRRVMWEVLGDQWYVMAFCKSKKYYTVIGRRANISCVTLFGKGSEIKNWCLSNQ